ncbi:MAG: hypothetical protein ACU833_05520 [Gammaproteobacteria bacterium]
MNKIKTICAILPALTLIVGAAQSANAATPEGRDKVRIHTSFPKKNGDSLFSYTVQWRIDGSLTYESTGLSFISGPDRPKATSDVEAAHKLVVALEDGMLKQYPSWRGAHPVQPEGKPEMTVSNKAGFSFTNLTFRDYSNQKLSYDMEGKSFSEGRVTVGLDFVYAADVEYLGDFIPQNIKRVAKGGTIEISLDGGNPITVKTDGKTTEQIEKEIASALTNAKFETTPLFPNTRDGDARNSKPFDGGEVQIAASPAKSITIDISDTSLGILTKFQFPDDDKPVNLHDPLKVIIILGCLIAVGWFGYTWYRDKDKEENA